jgi:C-terminal processing protease CtpA/Prc
MLQFCGPTVIVAMGFVAHTDALIFDLRQNGGGQPAMVTLIASYLFDKPTHRSTYTTVRWNR